MIETIQRVRVLFPEFEEWELDEIEDIMLMEDL